MPETPEVIGFVEKVSTTKGVWDELASVGKTTASTSRLSHRKGKGKGKRKSAQPTDTTTDKCTFTFAAQK